MDTEAMRPAEAVAPSKHRTDSYGTTHTIVAERQTCECGKEFWRWPGSHAAWCAVCIAIDPAKYRLQERRDKK